MPKDMTMTKVSVSLFVVLSLVTVSPAAAADAPGPTSLIAPHGSVAGTTIAFSWQAVPQATAYKLNIYGKLSVSGDDDILEVWYTAEQAGCASTRSPVPNAGTCTVMLTPPVHTGTYIWRVDTWGPGGSTPSNLLSFVMKDPAQSWGGTVLLSSGVRFSPALGGVNIVGIYNPTGAWVDNETGLIWSQPESGTFNGTQALFVCQEKEVAARRGFRLPTRDELQTLADPTQSNPSLPDGHPFILSGLKFWTHTRETLLANNATFTFIVDFFTGDSSTVQQTQLNQKLGVWCVRGSGGR